MKHFALILLLAPLAAGGPPGKPSGLPGALGGLTAEAEMVGADGRQLTALVWNRNATAVCTDVPCTEFGPTLRVESYAARSITNLDVPQASGARPAAEGQKAAR